MIVLAHSDRRHVVQVATVNQVVLRLCLHIAGACLVDRDRIAFANFPDLPLLVVVDSHQRVPAIFIDVEESLRSLVAHALANRGLDDPDTM
ncbi:hypothetical protein D3C80_1426770 [compost metagenome]